MQHLTSARRQRGVSMIATMVALTVAAVLLTGAIRQRMEALHEQAGTAAGQALQMINSALGAYMTNPTNSVEIRTHGTIAGVADIAAPTISELQTMGLLSGAMDATPSIGGEYMISIVLLPDGCAPMDCNIASRLWLRNPVTELDGFSLDIKRLGAMMGALKGYGGFSEASSPGTVRGTSRWSLANPDTARRAGIVMAINGFGSTIDSNYVRIRDDRDPDLQGKLDVAGDIVSKGLVGVGGAVFRLGGACTKEQQGFLGKSETGTLLLCNAERWQYSSGIDQEVVAGKECTSGAVGRGKSGFLFSCQGGVFKDASGFPHDVVSGADCPTSGLFGMDVAGMGYMCRAGSWFSQASLSPSAVEMSRRYVTDGELVDIPKCADRGIPDYHLNLQAVALDLTHSPPYSGVDLAATTGATSWTIHIRLKAPDGSTVSANEFNMGASMRTVCVYPF